MNNNYNSLKIKVSKFEDVTTRPMFGYLCFSINKKFFVGFSNKNNFQIIVRLPKEEQTKAITSNGIKPFSHGAKMGWIEISTKQANNTATFRWITKAYNYAKKLAKSS